MKISSAFFFLEFAKLFYGFLPLCHAWKVDGILRKTNSKLLVDIVWAKDIINIAISSYLLRSGWPYSTVNQST